jgi:hypothetical protein
VIPGSALGGGQGPKYKVTLGDYHPKGDPAPPQERVVRLKSARVVAADYDLLARDFVELDRLTDEAIEHWHRRLDAWLLDRTGYMAETQVRNSEAELIQERIAPEMIDRNSPAVTAYRPEGQRRGLVFSSPDNRKTIDFEIKGAGARDPQLSRLQNRNGLISLAESKREFDMAHEIGALGERIAKDTHGAVRILERGHYAVIDWGFKMKDAEGKLIPAGAVVRRPAPRTDFTFNSGLPPDRALETELALRKYGVTSAGKSHVLRVQNADGGEDVINLQGRVLKDGSVELVDFGTIVRVPEGHEFDRPLAIRKTRFGSLGALSEADQVGMNRFTGVLDVMLSPDNPSFVKHATVEDAISAARFETTDASLSPERDRLTLRSEAWVNGLPSASCIQTNLPIIKVP